ncbi:MAG: hypothetical protein ABSA02_32995 [Trebonia sp.]
MASSRDLDRIEETGDGLADLRASVTTWFDVRRARDVRRQYWTQLAALERVLQPGIARVQDDVDKIRRLPRTGDVHAACRRNDRRVHLLDRYWRYFGDKWDQRDDKEVGLTLLAADEVTWSCWATPFNVSGTTVAPAPLPYLEPFYTPRAIPRTKPPADVQRADALLRSALETLPLPVTGLPPVVHSRPWWLASLAHENGHHLQRDFAGGSIYTSLGAVLEIAARADAEPASWRGWHEEIFADACSVLWLGPSAAVATAEMLQTADALMLAEDDTYPSVVVRQRLMEQMLADAACQREASVPAFRPDSLADFELDPTDEPLRTRARTRLDVVKPVAGELMRRAMDGDTSLPALCDWAADRYAGDGEVAFWRDELLRDGKDPLPETEPHTARTALAGGVAAWQAIAAHKDAVWRADARHRLAARMTSLLPLCRPEGRRGGGEPSLPNVTAADAALAAVLFGDELQADP